MLVFTRKAGQSLMIGDNITIKVLSVDRDQIRIGISAPRKIPVHREEVYRAIVNQNRLASRPMALPKDLLAKLKPSSGEKES